MAELKRLESRGVIKLAPLVRGESPKVVWVKPIKEKAIVIMEQEQVGYKQSRLLHTDMAAYMEYLAGIGVSEFAPGVPVPSANVLCAKKCFEEALTNL